MPRKLITNIKPILLILVLAFVLRLIPLNQSLWLDEAINVTAARDRGVLNLITDYSLGDFHPPLYHLLLRFWIKLYDASEVATRLLSVTFGLLTIYLTYRISKLLFIRNNLKVGKHKIPLQLIPPILLATSGLHTYYSGEARMYSLAALLATSSIYFLLLLRRPQRKLFPISLKHHASHHILTLDKRHSFLLITSLFLMLLSDYLPWLLLPLFFLFLPVHTLISALLTAPWWPFFYKQLNIGLGVASDYPLWNQVVGAFSLKNLALIPIKFTIGRVSIDNNFFYALALAVPLLIVSGLIYHNFIAAPKGHKKLISRIILGWLFLPLILGSLLSLKISLLSFFRFLFVLPAFYLLLVIPLTRLKPKLSLIIIAILVFTNAVSTSAYLFLPKFHREDWRAFSGYVDSIADPTALTVFPSLAQSAPYLYYQQSIPATDKIDFKDLPGTIYLVRYVQEIFDPQDLHRQQIEDLGYQLIEQNDFNGVIVWTYLRSARLYAQNQL